MVSCQAHNLNKKVRFLSLLMNFDTLNFLILLSFIILLLDLRNLKINHYYTYSFIVIVCLLILHPNLYESTLFNLSLWKTIFLTLITLSFFIILNLVQDKTFDVYCLLILVYLGSLILILSDNLITLYLGLELQTFSIFILIAKNRESIKGSEAGLKYFMLGAISSGFYLIGLTILFLQGYNFNIGDILMLTEDSEIMICLTLISLSFCFKLSLFPFHFWIPDIYEGSSWDILAIIATLPKISVISVLVQLLINTNIIISLCLLSIGIGTLGALNQTKLKRLLGYSGISHMGFIVLGYSMMANLGSTVGGFYLAIYMLTMLSVFILIISSNIGNEFIIELGGLKFINKILAATLILLVLSIAGIPPLSGFMSKWYLIWVALENYHNFSSIIMIFFSAIGLGYYLRIVKVIYFQKKSSFFTWKQLLSPQRHMNELSLFSMGFLFYMTLFLILNFSFIINVIDYILYYFY